jgi:hypothetical protein
MDALIKLFRFHLSTFSFSFSHVQSKSKASPFSLASKLQQ